MSSYLVLARKYRPKQFSDIVGQQSVVRTLVNAMKLKRTHQAYVFSGSRGIGKTSIARIFSKALRCPNVVEKEDGLLYSCDQCSDCIEIAAGTSVNVLEIDGASNNGVDSVREIRENAKFLPSSGLYKVYIIDEVHMLSTAAFNALLKTLEEPPEHVVFIFATTESHKIPETILGRCQRFDFKRVTVAQIIGRLKDVLASEKISYEEAALNLIARASEGSMRDALSITDQVISFSGMNITAQSVRDSIGLIGTEMVYALLKNVLERDAKSALTIVQGAFTQGVDLKVLLKVVIEMLHALILMQVGIEKPETHFNDDELKQLAGLKNARPLEENELIFQVFHHGLDLLARASQPKLVFDLLLVKTALAETIMKVEDIRNESSASATRRSPRLEGTEEVPAQPNMPSLPPSQPEIVPVTPKPEIPQPNQPAKQPPEITPPNPMTPQPEIPAPSYPEVPQPDVPEHQPIRPIAFATPKPLPKPVPLTLVKAPPAENPTWEGFVELCFLQRPVLAVILESVVEWTLPKKDDNAFKLGFREHDKGKADQLMQKVFKDQLAAACEGYFGFKAQPEVFFSKMSGESVAEKVEREKKEVTEEKMKSIYSNEIVVEARSLFGVELSQVELLEGGA